MMKLCVFLPVQVEISRRIVMMDTQFDLLYCFDGSETYKVATLRNTSMYNYNKGRWCVTGTYYYIVSEELSHILNEMRDKLILEGRWKLTWRFYIIKDIIGTDVFKYICWLVSQYPWPHRLLCY